MHFSTILVSAGYLSLAFATSLPLDARGKKPKYNCPCAKPAYLKSVKRQFATDQIVPDLIERINPTVEIDLSYGTKAVQLGTYFTTLETLSQPTFSFTAEPNYNPATTTYSIFMIDPDVPQNGSPVQENFCHWVLSGLHPSCITNQSPQAPTVLYESPTPASTTQHRYTFLVYREPPGYTVSATDLALLNIRTPFDINDYTEYKNLTLVGGNFFKEAITNGLQGGK